MLLAQLTAQGHAEPVSSFSCTHEGCISLVSTSYVCIAPLASSSTWSDPHKALPTKNGSPLGAMNDRIPKSETLFQRERSQDRDEGLGPSVGIQRSSLEMLNVSQQ